MVELDGLDVPSSAVEPEEPAAQPTAKMAERESETRSVARRTEVSFIILGARFVRARRGFTFSWSSGRGR